MLGAFNVIKLMPAKFGGLNDKLLLKRRAKCHVGPVLRGVPCGCTAFVHAEPCVSR
jgi:hypothetical protein